MTTKITGSEIVYFRTAKSNRDDLEGDFAKRGTKKKSSGFFATFTVASLSFHSDCKQSSHFSTMSWTGDFDFPRIVPKKGSSPLEVLA